MTEFHLLIEHWYRLNQRELPWRSTKNPYFIWLSEVILQQTRVNQGLNYYIRFTQQFPELKDLALASEQEILNLWQGLGYYSRARNLHSAAKFIYNELNSRFPESYSELLKLKGVGNYTAAAIASFSFNEAVPVIDGNVYRVLGRVFDIEYPIDSTIGKKVYAELAEDLLNKKDPATYNQAIMEFGALQCTPTNPDCPSCILSEKCLSNARGTTRLRPVKSRKKPIKDRYFYYLIFEFDNQFIIEKRTKKDIWQNLYQFPAIEAENVLEDFSTEETIGLQPYFISSEVIHILSHQRIHAKFLHFNCSPKQMKDQWIIINQEQLTDYPISRLMDRYLEYLPK